MRLSVMDFTAAHNDLNVRFLNALLDLDVLFETFGKIHIYIKYQKFYPESLAIKCEAAGHALVAMPSEVAIEPVAEHIIRDIWKCDPAYREFVIISPSLDFIPVAKALTHVGRRVTMVSFQNVKVFEQNGIDHQWIPTSSPNLKVDAGPALSTPSQLPAELIAPGSSALWGMTEVESLM